MIEALHIPTGFDYVPDYYVMDRDCYWKNGKPVNEKYWSLFKQLQDYHLRVQMLMNKPMAFSMYIIQETFNPVFNSGTGMMIRDSVFAFRAFIKNLHDDHLTLSFSQEYNSFIIGYNHLYN